MPASPPATGPGCPCRPRTLVDSHISLQIQAEMESHMDRLEALHTTMHGDGPGRLSVAVPTSQARNHPGRPGEAQHGMGGFLPCGIAFQRRVERTQAWRFPLAQTPC